ncbi:MAG: UDP-N-acetylglucosamine 2-epimerase (non-hydrolyzing) [Clostridia bacterium]|nr:UDP-N-acetylglucosamine 2-epimerase (non-hydrolyzing) [Clostridia bacterium]
MTRKKIMSIFGTRPEAIKMAPLIKALEKEKDFQSIVVVSAQHREMLDQVLDLFQIKPQYDLNIMQAGQTLSDITCRVLKGLEPVLEKEKPDMILVHGDTTTTFAAALAAFYHKIPVGHVEAGLRSGNMYSPFPEEINRKLTAGLTTLHFAPTPTAKENLIGEGVREEQIFVTGNTVIDALLATVKPDYKFNHSELQAIDFANKRVILVTAHRRENLGEPMKNIFQALVQLHEEFNDIEIIFPVHKNPAVRNLAFEILGDYKRIHLIEPLDYEPFANLLAKCYFILTDSGGLQEEAPALGKPVLVLRENTERPEAVAAGTVALVGTQKQKIFYHSYNLLVNLEIYAKMERAVNPYGDGKSCSRIIEALKFYFKFIRIRPRDWFCL